MTDFIQLAVRVLSPAPTPVLRGGQHTAELNVSMNCGGRRGALPDRRALLHTTKSMAPLSIIVPGARYTPARPTPNFFAIAVARDPSCAGAAERFTIPWRRSGRRVRDCVLGEGWIWAKLEAICSLGGNQRHGAFDLRTQRDPGRLLRSPRNGRRRRDAPRLDARDGRGGSDALRAPDIRADGGRLAPARDPKAARSSRDWAKKLDAKPKYVVSTTRRDFPWSNTHHVQGDLTRAVKVLKKATPGGLLAVPVSTASSAMTPPDMSITISRAAMVRLSNSPETARGPPASPNSFLLQSCHLNCAPPWGRRKRSSRASLIRRYGCLVK